MILTVLIMLLLFLSSASAEETLYEVDKHAEVSQVTVMPEVPAFVELSSSDVNRIVCPPGTEARDVSRTDVVFSKEKGIVVKIAGRNVFVKFALTKEDGKEIYSATPSELFIVCNDTVYNIIAVPKRIPSRTVRLSEGIDRVKKNISTYGVLPFEKKVIALIKAAYRNEIPDTFKVIPSNKKVEVFRDVSLTLRRVVLAEGLGLRLNEYEVILKTERDFIEIREKDFLKTDVTTRTVAVAAERLILKKGETVRVFVVELVSDI